ncbi:FecR family protein [Chitinophaga sp. 22321]|uniref:FecR domain-containing protein n=1 Tax=Chitinophaga hostae TaxID=2831022 RepID=A0ABS5JAK4_9BACT|nr:FecR domain-containing protein [Chitinophaga hostae]MBS0032238.1 FecR domain-containing protein [Chitinophaga hostae]
MSTSEFKNIVARYLRGEASAMDQAMIEAWLAATEDNPVDLSEAELLVIREDMLQHLRDHSGHLAGAVKSREEEMNNGLYSAAPVNGLQEASVPHTESTIRDRKLRETPVRRLIPWLQRIAVAVIFGIGIISLYYYWHSTAVKPAPVAENTPEPQYRVRITATTAIRKVRLPDSSLVVINRAGSLYYNMPFGKNKREIFLDAGEAFFEVKTNAGTPFTVHAGSTTTTVLGTSFNIRVTDNVSSVKVAVKTGKVKVTTRLNTRDSSRLLQPEQGIEINTINNSVRTFSQPAGRISSWWDGVLVFHQSTMKEVVEALENAYQVHIHLATPALQQYRVSGDFTRSHTLTEVLDALCLVHRLSYQKKNNEYFIYSIIKKPVMR